MIPWELYNLTPRDQGSPNIRPYFSRTANIKTASDISDQVDHSVPADYILLVTNVEISCRADGTTSADFPDYVRLMILESNLIHYDSYRPYMPGIGFGQTPLPDWTGVWQGSPLMLVHPRDVIRTVSRIQGIGQAWEAIHNVAGVLIPKGTIDAH